MRSRVAAAAMLAMLSTVGPVAAAGASEPSGTHSVPPAAPNPTDSGNSPAAPDPSPPRGGLGPDGDPVGGQRLLARRTVLPAKAPALPQDLTARAWLVSDLDTGAVIAARDPHGRYQPASIQKVLTTLTLLPLLPGSKRVTVSRGSAETEGSHAGLVAGGRYTVDQMFRGLLLVSGNDCAEALAAAAGGRAHTVALMNRTARRLGAFDTLVETPSGLDGWQQLTSAYDMTLFLRAALRQPRFVAYDKAATSILPRQSRRHIGAVKLYNQNQAFLTEVKGALVAKTGFTDAAQHTFVGAIERGGHRYGVVLMRAQRYPHDQYVQATKLVRWATRLPAGTAPVGRLHSPAVAKAPGGATAAAGTRTAPAAGTASGGDGGPSGVWIVAVAAIGGAAVIGVVLRRSGRI